jgi:MarR family transcriptional regulator, organic hydroperoxide resistance regulator
MLELLWDADGRTIGDLARMLHVSAPTVAKMVTRMEATGFVRRKRSELDTRVVRVYLTPQGRDVRRSVDRELDGLVAQMTSGMSDRERTAFERGLRRVIDAMLE